MGPTYTVAPNGRIEVANTNGRIEVLPHDRGEIEVRAEREARSHSDEAARALLQNIDMREDVAPARVRIEAAAPSGERFAGFGRRRGVSILYTVRVPAGVTVAVKTQSGGIRVRSVSGRIEAGSVNGTIVVEELTGSLDANVVNGGVRADLAAVTGDVTVASTNGTVRLDLPADVRAELDAAWTNGTITIDPAFGVDRGDRAANQFRATLNGGGPRISVRTVNGAVRIRRRWNRETD